MTTALLNTPADIVRQALVNVGQCAEYNSTPWPAYALVIPPTLDDCVTVFNGTDVIDGRVMQGTILQHYGIQLRIRGDVSDTAAAKAAELQRWMAEDVYGLIVSGGPRLTGSYKIFNFARIGPVLRLGMGVPGDKRYNFTVNALVVIRNV